mmetsp:Transcript_686/g.2048  ORF Transcript_686/g.2048 Transcript_686/m.2048 type:complete len:410 (-) Transcript_686:126-1355(-)|eukprot:CAMPEP_0113543436 /NCGR_PEP_ID=MMETSP0015_2-20120614/10157_1 /TAXON_ID=2838 /ORGANISM="Odontella" /LENGTH=409 /DNA_ID=CAMNT_0000443595 /DNA_START=90 /DNA_END=1319 /DNA_ORIENTATION=- /assembly_acc=CAM_ASM_000160
MVSFTAYRAAPQAALLLAVGSCLCRSSDAYGAGGGNVPTRRQFVGGAASAAAAAAAGVPGIALPGVASASTTTSSGLAGSIDLPPIGLGAWAWGDSVFWGYDKKNDDDLKEVFDYALSKDLAFFDTAEIYGFGRSETLLGQFRDAYPKEQSDKVQIASKFAAFPFRTKPKDVVNACKASLKRLGSDRPIDLYQIHFPNAWSNEEYWDGVAMCHEQGLVKSVGVSNYGVDATRAAHAKLKERGIQLATNQIQYSLLYRWPQENGLLDVCKELDVKVLSYSPLALGFLTGKYDKGNLPSGPRSKIGEQLFATDGYSTLLSAMRKVASNHGDDVPVSQVALNWARAKGTIPIPGARTVKQAKQNIGSMDWSMTDAEVALLDEASSEVTGFVTPDKSPFPKKDINTGLIMFDS